jgi:glyoxylase-like metal-dependent hydrolase (beta-lactamase superfamily II)
MATLIPIPSPTMTRAESTASQARGTHLISPSHKVPLLPGQKIKDTDYERAQRPYTIQQLTRRVYWIESLFYQSTVVIGKQGVMVIDPLSYGRGKQVLRAIRTLTRLPITTLVYSHYHFDHVGDAMVFVQEARRTRTPLRIVGTTAGLEEIRKYGTQIPLPTEVLPVPRATFMFEGDVVEIGTPPAGHTPDNSWILLPTEGVIHNVDVIHPGQIEFENFGMAQDLDGYEKGVRELLTLEWKILNAGHGNIGSRADVQLVVDYLTDLRACTRQVIGQIDIRNFIKQDTMIYAWFQEIRDTVAMSVVEGMRPGWGHYPGFDLASLSHARAMYWEYFLHSAPTENGQPQPRRGWSDTYRQIVAFLPKVSLLSSRHR